MASEEITLQSCNFMEQASSLEVFGGLERPSVFQAVCRSGTFHQKHEN